MIFKDPAEQAGFLVFILLAFASIFVFSAAEPQDWAYGMVALGWGLAGLWRLMMLSDQYTIRISRLALLPTKLLAALGQRQQEHYHAITERMSQRDIALWAVGGLGFVGWAVFTTLFPSVPEALNAFDLSVARFLNSVNEDGTFSSAGPLELLARHGAFMFSLGAMIFLALSYAHTRKFIYQALAMMLPAMIVGISTGIVLYDFAPNFSLPDISVFNGWGVGMAPVIEAMMAQDGQAATSFIRRYQEMGSIGAWLPYLLALPAAYGLARDIDQQYRNQLVGVAGLICLLLLACHDMFWAQSFLSPGLVFTGWLITGLCWGEAGYSRQRAFAPFEAFDKSMKTV